MTATCTKARNTRSALTDRPGMPPRVPPCPPHPSRYGPAPMSAAASATDYRALLARQNWKEIRKNLKLFAYKATGSRSMDRAEDFAQDAIARLWTDAGVRWDPATEPNLFRFLTGLVRGELSNERRLKETTSVTRPGRETIEAHADPRNETPERLLLHAETSDRVLRALRERAAKDAIGLDVVDMYERRIDDAADQAKASGHSIEDIRRARRRVSDHAAAIYRELGEEAEVT